MDDVRIESTREGAVRVITLARAEKRNALSMAMFEVLIGAFEQEPPPAQRLTLLRAEGPVFCAGVDLGQRAERAVAEGESPLERLCAAITGHQLPVVAAVQGAAIGGGLMIALHCDFVVAVDEAKVGNSAVQLGLAPPWPITRRVADAAGPALARELLIGGDLVPAERLAAAHVIAAAVPAAEFDAEVERIVERLALNAPLLCAQSRRRSSRMPSSRCRMKRSSGSCGVSRRAKTRRKVLLRGARSGRRTSWADESDVVVVVVAPVRDAQHCLRDADVDEHRPRPRDELSRRRTKRRR